MLMVYVRDIYFNNNNDRNMAMELLYKNDQSGNICSVEIDGHTNVFVSLKEV